MFDSSPSSFRSASKTDDEAGAGKTKSNQITHLMHYKASTMFPLRQLQSLLIVIPPWENACSLETEKDITVLKQSIRRSHVTGPPKSVKSHRCPMVTSPGGETISQEKCVFRIFQIQILIKTGKIGKNIDWSHVPSECGETKFLLQWSQVTWGGELIDLVQYCKIVSS
jgi:hypothetical protein